MSEPITHAFISAKTQSPDTTLVSKNEWNDGHLFLGGVNGQVLIYDNTQPNNMRWTDGPALSSNVASGGASASPLVGLVPVTITTSGPGICLALFTAYAVLSGAGTVSINLLIDGVLEYSQGFVSGGAVALTWFRGVSLAAGTYTFTLNYVASAGTFVSYTAELGVLRIGT